MLPAQLKILELSSSLLRYEIKGNILPITLIELKLTGLCCVNLNLNNSPPSLQKLYILKSYKGSLIVPNHIIIIKT